MEVECDAGVAATALSIAASSAAALVVDAGEHCGVVERKVVVKMVLGDGGERRLSSGGSVTVMKMLQAPWKANSVPGRRGVLRLLI